MNSIKWKEIFKIKKNIYIGSLFYIFSLRLLNPKLCKHSLKPYGLYGLVGPCPCNFQFWITCFFYLLFFIGLLFTPQVTTSSSNQTHQHITQIFSKPRHSIPQSTNNYDLWVYVSIGLWAHGPVGLWCYGSMGPWACVCIGLCVFGPMGLYAYCGSMGLWAHGPVSLWAYVPICLWTLSPNPKP